MIDMFEVIGIAEDKREVMSISGSVEEHFETAMMFLDKSIGLIQIIFRFYSI